MAREIDGSAQDEMSDLSTHERVARLERAFLMIAAVVSGELERTATPEERQAAYQQLGADLTGMKDDL
jgi:hypothetical protein